jgi:penicillin G amidase
LFCQSLFMRIFKFILSLLATIGLIWVLQTPQKAGDKKLPALGHFFNPFTGFWRNAESAKGPILPKEINIPGLSAPVEIVYDDLLVPHIFAANLADAWRTQGYITAQHRLWQMDIVTRRAAGRLSEVVGRRALESDKLMRRRGMVFAAENALKATQLDPETAKLIEAYSEGVNAWVSQLKPQDYPIEFKLLGYAPEPWSPLKTALVLESMADNLAARADDGSMTNTLRTLGMETFKALYPEWNPDQTPIVPDIGQWKGIKPGVDPTPVFPSLTATEQNDNHDLTNAEPDAPFRAINGSNNWAVAPQRTASGHPLLANDPHLNLTLPSIWFQTHIHTPEQSAYGACLAGIPGVVIGFNEDIAWGMTNVSHDVADWYKITWTDASRTEYMLDGKPQKADLKIETYRIDGEKDPVLDTVRYTRWGPVVYDKPDHTLRDCALRWITHDVPTGSEMSMSRFLNLAKNHADYAKAIAPHECPAQNFVFASRSGDIAIRVQGKYPIRRPEQGRFIQDGSQSANAWAGFMPQENIPAQLNPSRQYVFSANQHSTPPTYPYYYLGEFDDFRARRIHDRLEKLRGATIDSMKLMQLDNVSYRAVDILPTLLKQLDRSGLDPVALGYATVLEKWDYNYDKDAVAPILFEMWYDSCYVHTWDELINIRKEKKIDLTLPEAWRFNVMLKKDTTNRFFDLQSTPQRETARNIIRLAFDEMVKNATIEAVKGNFTWGKFRGFELRHLGQIAPFGKKDIIVSGHRNAPNAISKTHGPSWRMIVELSTPVKALGVYPGGQSGNPGSKFYDNFVDAWVNGDYYELLLPAKPEEVPAERMYAKQVASSK